MALAKTAMPDRKKIEKWRFEMLGEKHDLLNSGFWIDRETFEVEDLKSIRILVCGNTGVGKSTLVNRIFGVSESDEVVRALEMRIEMSS